MTNGATEHQERAYIAASRRADRSLEARVQSALMASQVHKQRTGKSLYITEEIVACQDIYEEQDDRLLRRQHISNAEPSAVERLARIECEWRCRRFDEACAQSPLMGRRLDTSCDFGGKARSDNVETPREQQSCISFEAGQYDFYTPADGSPASDTISPEQISFSGPASRWPNLESTTAWVRSLEEDAPSALTHLGQLCANTLQDGLAQRGHWMAGEDDAGSWAMFLTDARAARV